MPLQARLPGRHDVRRAAHGEDHEAPVTVAQGPEPTSEVISGSRTVGQDQAPQRTLGAGDAATIPAQLPQPDLDPGDPLLDTQIRRL